MAVSDFLDDDGETTSGSRVWGPRVQQGPIINSTADASSRWASDWSNSTQNTWMSKADAVGLYGKLPQWQRDMFEGIARATPSGMDTGKSVYERYTDSSAAYEAQGLRRSAAELAMQDVNDGVVKFDPSEDDSGGRGRGYSGPVSTVTRMNQLDLDRTANALAVEMIGRTLSDKELAKVTNRMRTAETQNPSVSGGASQPSLTVQSGLSAEGRQDVLKEVIAENPEYADYQLDHTVLDTMLSVFNKRKAQVRG